MTPTYMEIANMCLTSSSIYNYLDNGILSNELKSCRYKGAKEQLLVDKTILNDFKWKHKNLSMACLDYKKAYNMVLYFWIIVCLKPVNVSKNMIKFAQRLTSPWKTEIVRH